MALLQKSTSAPTGKRVINKIYAVVHNLSLTTWQEQSWKVHNEETNSWEMSGYLEISNP